MSYFLVSPCRPLADVLTLDCLTPDAATYGAGTGLHGEQYMNKGEGTRPRGVVVRGCWRRAPGVRQGDFPEEGLCMITRQRCRRRRSHAAGFWAPQVRPELASALVRDC